MSSRPAANSTVPVLLSMTTHPVLCNTAPRCGRFTLTWPVIVSVAPPRSPGTDSGDRSSFAGCTAPPRRSPSSTGSSRLKVLFPPVGGLPSVLPGGSRRSRSPRFRISPGPRPDRPAVPQVLGPDVAVPVAPGAAVSRIGVPAGGRVAARRGRCQRATAAVPRRRADRRRPPARPARTRVATRPASPVAARAPCPRARTIPAPRSRPAPPRSPPPSR